MGHTNPHLDDDALAELWTDRLTHGPEGTGRPADSHLHGCAECRTRYSAFAAWLEDLRVDATAEADQALSPERLAAQQSQILRRLEALDHPGRVIAFPKSAPATAATVSRPQRWIAAAAAAGLIVGLGLGQVFEFRRAATTADARPQPEQQIIARGGPAGQDVTMGMGVQPASQLSDENVLDDYAPSPTGPVRVPDSLQYLNAVTPGARDYDPR